MATTAMAQEYQVFDLGTLGGAESRAWDLNASAQVAGTSLNADEIHRGFLYTDGVMTALQTPRATMSSALAINDAGHVAGRANGVGGSGPAIYKDGDFQFLGSLNDEGTSGHTRGLSNTGLAAGWSVNENGWREAYFWDGKMQGLGTFGGRRSESYDLNDLGHVVGFAEDVDDDARGFIWTGDELVDLGTLGGSETYAHAINNSGLVVGESRNEDNEYRGFLWMDGVMEGIPTLGGDSSALVDVNEAGMAVGISKNEDDDNRAIIYDPDLGLIDLNTLVDSDLVLVEAWGINDAGAVVGLAITPEGHERAFLAIPAPATLLIFTPMLVRRRRHTPIVLTPQST